MNVDQSHVCLPMRHSICVSGAAAGQTVIDDAELAERLGAEIARLGHVLTTGATVGLPYFAAKGAKSQGGASIGFSPASSLREHLRKYRLPHCYFDFINFTGMNYVGRDQYLVQSSDAVISVGGRFGSLHEFVTAVEMRKPCGVLIGSGGAADLVAGLIQSLDPSRAELVMYDEDPESLVRRMVELLDRQGQDIKKDMERNEHWFLEKPGRSHSG